MQHTSSNVSSNIWHKFVQRREFNINRCTLHPSLSIKLKEDLEFTNQHWICQYNLHFTTYLDNLVTWHTYTDKEHKDRKPLTEEHYYCGK
jgi:hypothetical protein